MTEVQSAWRNKTDGQLIHAAIHIETYTTEGREAISAELARRQMRSVSEVQKEHQFFADRRGAWIKEFNGRFPGMKLITRPPLLIKLNGTGLAVVGRRDYDALTGSYVRTLAVTVLWTPIFMLRAYRVLDATDGTLLFMGTEPLSVAAMFWNFVSIPALIIGMLLIGRF